MSNQTARALYRLAHQWLDGGVAAICVAVSGSKGSTPRDAGARMLVSAEDVQGTIGGGHLEWQAIDLARHALAESAPTLPAAWERTVPLGPALGQCCGGVVALRFAPLSTFELTAWPKPPAGMHFELHGAGHVGQAIIRLLADLDCTVRWIDTRDDTEALPGLPTPAMLSALPPHIQWLSTDAPEAEVAHAPHGAFHLVFTHRHDLDLRIIEAVLRRGDARFAGLIGSQTKRARFLHKLQERGLSEAQLATLTCPIGLPGLVGKEPAVIAIATVAQLLQHQQAYMDHCSVKIDEAAFAASDDTPPAPDTH
jgi:xanthine dehydrogenase accessory factor